MTEMSLEPVCKSFYSYEHQLNHSNVNHNSPSADFGLDRSKLKPRYQSNQISVPQSTVKQDLTDLGFQIYRYVQLGLNLFQTHEPSPHNYRQPIAFGWCHRKRTKVIRRQFGYWQQ